MITGKLPNLACTLENKSESQTFIDLTPLGLTNLSALTVNNKKYPKLENIILLNITLITLDLSRNEIETFSAKSFSGIASVSNLSLRTNNLITIANLIDGFSNNHFVDKTGSFVSLRSLDLSFKQHQFYK